MKYIIDKVAVPFVSATYKTNAVIATPDVAPSGKIPLVMSFHGTGEAGNDINRLFNSGLPNVIKNGWNPPAGQEFIMLAPQRSSYSIPPEWIDGMLSDMLKRYPNIDTDRIYLTGYSAGGWGTYGSQLNILPTIGSKIAAILPLSAATQDSQIANVANFKITNTPVLAIVGGNDTSYKEQNERMVAAINGQVPGLAKIYIRSGVGHSGWNDVYKGTWKDENGKTAWDWLFSKTRYVAPIPEPTPTPTPEPTPGITAIYVLYDDGTWEEKSSL